MITTKQLYILLAGIFFCVLIAGILLLGLVLAFIPGTRTNLFGNAISGVSGRIATSSLQAMSANTVRLLFATTTDCVARTITTRATDIMLTFSDFQADRPTNVSGHLQLASTSVAYPSDAYGCGAVYVLPYGGTSLYVSETR